MGAHIEELSDGLYMIDPYMFGSEGYIALYFVTKPKTLLFDVGPSSTAQTVIEAIESLGYGGDKIDYIFVSHVHLEHSGGLARIASWATKARIVLSPASLRHVADPSKMYQSYLSQYGRFAQAVGGFPPLPQETMSRVLSATTEIPFADRKALVLQFTGHAHHQICLSLDDTLFGADMLSTQLRLGGHLLPTSTPPSFNYSKYTEDLDRALALNPTRLLLSHYGPYTNPTEVLTEALESLKWLRHQVELLLKEGLQAEEVAETLLKDLTHTPPIDPEYARTKARINLLGFINTVIKIRSERT